MSAALPTPASRPSRSGAVRRWPHRSRWLRWIAALALIGAAAALGHRIALQDGLDRLRDTALHRLDMLAAELEADLARFEYLPALLQMGPVVPALLDAPSDSSRRAAVNRYLNGISATIGAEMLYVLDRSGRSIAASDWDQPGTTLGREFGFRPYVRDALLHGRGRFYGVGVTSGRPGYYLSYALRRDREVRGIVVVKVNIEQAEQGWQKLPGQVLLLDERGVVILSTRADLRYRPLAALDTDQQAEVLSTRPYGDQALQPLRWQPVRKLALDTEMIRLDGRALLANQHAMRHAPWRLVTLDDVAPVQRQARAAAAIAGLVTAVALLLAVILWQRRRALRHKLANRAALQAAHDSLESTVAERTAQLRATQNELVHAGKMAALGQMSAGMAHELNQPLTALRTLSDNAAILLEHDRVDEVRGNLRRITGLVDRLARLTSQLKTLGHKSRPDQPRAPVLLTHCIADALAILDGALTERGVRVEVDVEPPKLAVLAEEAALGSVLVNLLKNAVDAMALTDQPLLRIEARTHADRVVLQVCDSGPGIDATILPRLFEPFVSSKPAGAGLGLGLVISSQLVEAFGGTLRASNSPDGGACFSVELPQAATGS